MRVPFRGRLMTDVTLDRMDRIWVMLQIAEIAHGGCPFRRRIINGGETWVPLKDAERAVTAARGGA